MASKTPVISRLTEEPVVVPKSKHKMPTFYDLVVAAFDSIRFKQYVAECYNKQQLHISMHMKKAPVMYDIKPINVRQLEWEEFCNKVAFGDGENYKRVFDMSPKV